MPVSDVGKLPSRKVAHQWIALAYGEQEAAEAEKIPMEILHSMYETCLKYGPSGDSLLSFLKAYENLERHEAASINTSIELLGLELGEAGAVRSYWMHHKSELVDLDYRLRQLPTGHYRSVCWLIAGQKLFPPEVVEKYRPYLATMNGILWRLGEPSLFLNGLKR